MITGISHVNLTVPPGTLGDANAFYGETLGFHPVPPPELQKGKLAWFDITPNGQQIHIAFGYNEPESARHPCFKLTSAEDLLELQHRIWDHHVRGDSSAPKAADKPGEVNSVPGFPKRFFARDYAGNRLEFSL